MTTASKMAPSTADSRFLTIPLSSVPVNIELPYCIFVKIADNWILLRTKGDSIDEVRLAGLAQKKVACLGVLKTEWEAYVLHLETRLDETGVKEGDIDSALRVRSLLHAYFREIEERRDLEGSFLGKIRSTAEKMPITIGKDRAIANNLLKRDTDPSLYFSNHAVNTSVYSVAIGLKVGADLPLLQELAFCGAVANIGIIQVPKDILYKPSAPSESEWLVLRNHARLGHDILKLLLISDNICEAVLSHSERFDGTGYPRKISANDIPAAARVVTIAETFSALTSNRPWASALPAHRAVEVVQRLQGKFDPKILRLV